MKGQEVKYCMPAEWAEHEGTWLQWPHNNTADKGGGYREELDDIWVTLAKELHHGEIVHIVAYDEEEKQHITSKLEEADVNMDKIDFLIQPTDDIWIRDNGPIFVNDKDGSLVLTKWAFNGWGNRFAFKNDTQVSGAISKKFNIPMAEVDLCLEGGGIEVDGKGSLMAAKTSIINDNRNPGLSQEEIEEVITEHLGIKNFIWITGIRGADNHGEVTDFHIDGAARFVNEDTILYEYDVYGESEDYVLKAHERHYRELRKARGINGKPYNLIPVPITRKIVTEAGCRGSYLNYYIGNEAVLVPIYGDENDKLGLKIIEGQFPSRRIVGIDVSKLFQYGGMIHCVTQQQPKK